MIEGIHPTRLELILYSAFNPVEFLLDVAQTETDEEHEQTEVMTEQPKINEYEVEHYLIPTLQLQSVTLLSVKIWNNKMVLTLLYQSS